MVPEKRKRVSTEKLQYSHLMKFEKTKKWRDTQIQIETERERKREERERKKQNAKDKK